MKHTKTHLITTFALMLMSASALAEPFELEPLPYTSDALEPVIDQLTMNIHHGRHHRGYVNKLNAQVENHPELNELTIEQVMSRVSEFGEAVRNSGGGHYNHTLFWRVMAPAEEAGEPSGVLLEAIQRDFGSLSAFQGALLRSGGDKIRLRLGLADRRRRREAECYVDPQSG